VAIDEAWREPSGVRRQTIERRTVAHQVDIQTHTISYFATGNSDYARKRRIFLTYASSLYRVDQIPSPCLLAGFNQITYFFLSSDVKEVKKAYQERLMAGLFVESHLFILNFEFSLYTSIYEY